MELGSADAKIQKALKPASEKKVPSLKNLTLPSTITCGTIFDISGEASSQQNVSLVAKFAFYTGRSLLTLDQLETFVEL